MSQARKLDARAIAARKKGKEIAQNLIDTLNSMGDEKDVAAGFAEGILGSHRYLQGEFAEVLAAVVKSQAEAYRNGFYDARNEHFAKTCAALLPVLKDHYYVTD